MLPQQICGWHETGEGTGAPESNAAIQTDLDRLEKGADKNLTVFS